MKLVTKLSDKAKTATPTTMLLAPGKRRSGLAAGMKQRPNNKPKRLRASDRDAVTDEAM
jgi:hypothetical protein